MKCRLFYLQLIIYASILLCFSQGAYGQKKTEPLLIIIPANSSPRIKFGSDKLIDALRKTGYKVKLEQTEEIPVNRKFIAIAEWSNGLTKKGSVRFKLDPGKNLAKESFCL